MYMYNIITTTIMMMMITMINDKHSNHIKYYSKKNIVCLRSTQDFIEQLCLSQLFVKKKKQIVQKFN